MATVKINQKNYEVPEMNFRHSKIMEQMGLPLEGMMDKKYLFSAVSAFTAITAKCPPEQADHLIEQHILGGGKLEDIYQAYSQAVLDSAFFKKLLHLDEQENRGQKEAVKEEQNESTEQ